MNHVESTVSIMRERSDVDATLPPTLYVCIITLHARLPPTHTHARPSRAHPHARNHVNTDIDIES